MMNWCNLARFEKNGPKQRDAWTWYFATMYATVLLGNAFSPGGLLPNYSRHGLVLATKYRTHKKDDKWLQACRRLGWSGVESAR